MEIISLLWCFLLIFGLAAAQNQQCFSCKDEDCISSGTAFEMVDCGKASDKCFTIYTNYIPTKRGCLTSLTVEAEKTACADLADKSCSVCEGSNCNNLAHEDQTCLVCSTVQDRNCLTDPEKIASVRCAAPTIDSPLCYIRALGSVTERGCLTTEENLIGCTNENSCEFCSIANNKASCNSYEFPNGRQKCFTCSGDECLHEDTQTVEFCDYMFEPCVTVNAKGVFRKSCESKLSKEDANYCLDYPNHCLKCMPSECNAELNYLEKTECRSCSSAADKNCVDNPNAVPLVSCTNGCAIIVSPNSEGNLETKRMCVENLSATEKTACASKDLNPDSFQCGICGTDNCNSLIFPRNRLSCFHCSTPPCNTHESVKAEICPYYNEDDHCVAILAGSKIESLTCQSSLNKLDTTLCEKAEAVEGRSCLRCPVPNCNDPTMENPASCRQCSSDSNNQCSSNPGAVPPTPCKNTAEKKCYTEYEGNVIKRGCLTDLTAAEQENCNNGKKNCVACDGPGGCNHEIFPNNRLECFQCDSKTNPLCKDIYGLESTLCDTLVDTKCYTVVEETGLVTRSCSQYDEATMCDANKLYCRACESNGCNWDSASFEMPTTPDVVHPTLAPDVTTVAPTTAPIPTTSTTPKPAGGSGNSVISNAITVLFALLATRLLLN